MQTLLGLAIALRIFTGSFAELHTLTCQSSARAASAHLSVVRIGHAPCGIDHSEGTNSSVDSAHYQVGVFTESQSKWFKVMHLNKLYSQLAQGQTQSQAVTWHSAKNTTIDCGTQCWICLLA